MPAAEHREVSARPLQLFGGSYVERLLTEFSTPEELFVPNSSTNLTY